MNVKINDFNALSYELRMKIVAEYFKQNEESKMISSCVLSGFYIPERKVKETGKYPVKIEVNNSNYHVKCRKTNSFYVFDIWLAV